MASAYVKARKRRNVLTFAQKAKVLYDLEQGLSVRDVQQKYNIAEATVYHLKKDCVSFEKRQRTDFYF